MQGSELEKDYTRFRSLLINLILKKSSLIVCRNNNQIDFLKSLVDKKTSKCIVVNWGFDKKLFNIKQERDNKTINIISPRASQKEYNINLIFDAIKLIKKNSRNVKFTYICFNRNMIIKNEKIADKVIYSPSQMELWCELASSDICISIPLYDGFSNTVLESLALGNYLILSELKPYSFIKREALLGELVTLDKIH